MRRSSGIDKRGVLKAGLTMGVGLSAVGIARAQEPVRQSEAEALRLASRSSSSLPVPSRKLKTTRLFRSPEGFPNAIDATAEGLWIGEQRTDEGQGISNDAYLVDWDGAVVRKVTTECKNTSGLAYGDGYLWMGANARVRGIFQVDPHTGQTVSHRQIPLGPSEDGGGCHGVMFHEGKLWINALRLRGLLRVDCETWAPELLIPYSAPRTHATAWDDGTIWMVTGSLNGPSVDDDSAGLIRFDAVTGRVLETAEFDQSEFDPHGLTFHDGVMYGCDAGIHPEWPDGRSPSSGYIYRIDFA